MKNRNRYSLLATAILTAIALLSPITLPAGGKGFTAEAVYPNPFTIGTTFQLTMPQPGQIRISVFDLLGQQIRTLYEGSHPAGNYDIYWDGKDLSGTPVPPGVYVCSLFADNSVVKSVKVVKIQP